MGEQVASMGQVLEAVAGLDEVQVEQVAQAVKMRRKQLVQARSALIKEGDKVRLVGMSPKYLSDLVLTVGGLGRTSRGEPGVRLFVSAKVRDEEKFGNTGYSMWTDLAPFQAQLLAKGHRYIKRTAETVRGEDGVSEARWFLHGTVSLANLVAVD